MLDGTEYFECRCGSDEHAVTFTLALEDDPADIEMYLSVYMDNRRGFWRRAWLALRYAFGYQSQFGAFGNWILRHEDTIRLRDMCNRLIEHASTRQSKYVNYRPFTSTADKGAAAHD